MARKTSSTQQSATPTRPKKQIALSREERLLVLALENPKGIDAMLDEVVPDMLKEADAQALYKYLETFYNSSRDFQPEVFVQSIEKEDPTLANKLNIWQLIFDKDRAEIEDYDASQEFAFTLKKVQEENLRQKLARAEIELRAAEGNHEEQKARELTLEIQSILDRLHKVTRL